MTFRFQSGEMFAESVPLRSVAERFGTPAFVYSRVAIEDALGEFQSLLASRPSLVCYAVKANASLALLSLVARRGAGFDIVSGGELASVLAAGGDPRKVVFSGVGKTEAEIRRAIEVGILCINAESSAELDRIDRIAGRLGRRAPVALRVNPDVDARTHPYISTGLESNKFGIPIADAENLYLEAARRSNLAVVGVGCHIGSQLLAAGPYIDAAARIVALVERLETRGIRLEHIDLGGGFGIRYRDEQPAPLGDYVDGVLGVLAGRRESLILDPGRAIVGNAGVLLTRVEYVKPGRVKNFCIVDAAMNDLLRPSLYDAWHDVRPVCDPAPETPAAVYDVVGPACESGDFLARERRLAVREGDLVAVMSAGAYGMSMSSNYNSRPRAAEVMVDGDQAHLVRRRETVEDLIRLESIPPWA